MAINPPVAPAPAFVLAALQANNLTLDGRAALAVSLTEGKFITIVTARPVLGTLRAEAQWHYLSAWRVLQRGGAFRS